jgi:beta-propeller repeat-containing protein
MGSGVVFAARPVRAPLWCGVVVVAALAVGAVAVVHPPATGRPAAHSAIGALPLAFEPNVGQADRRVEFLARARGSTVYLLRSEAVLAFHRPGRADDVISMRFGGPGSAAHAAAADALPGASNYLRGSDPRGWQTGVPHFGVVRYDNVYPGIGLDFHGSADAQLEYDLRVVAGADPSDIAVRVSGARRLALAPNGDLVIGLRDTEIRQPRPLAWQTIAGTRRHVPVHYALRGASVGFRVGAYDRSRPLLIDPKVTYASYFGASLNEACDPIPGRDGSLYVTCSTDSPDLPRIGSIRPHQGQQEVYVAKLDRRGKHVVYETYLGSPGQDEVDSRAVDAKGQVYVTGFAAEGFPTTPGAYDTTFNGAPDVSEGRYGDAYVTKLSRDGSWLLYSTFIGGSGAEQANALALGHDGSVVITGITGSDDFPTTPGALRSTFGGGTGMFNADLPVPLDAFATRLDRSGSRLVYSTYLGGSRDDGGNAVALDDAGNAYYAGSTESPDFPTTPGALKTSFQTPPGQINGYVTKLDRRGGAAWSTYLGGPTRDSAWGIDVDRRQDVYVSGSTIGDFPVTAGAAQTTFGGIRDWFVAKLDRSGSSLDWATYLGGSDYDGLSPTLRLDRRGHADVVGPTASNDFPTTRDTFQPANAGGFDTGIVQLDRRGHLVFSSYLGGSGDEFGSVSALDRDGNLYAGGLTTSRDFPVTPNAIQPTFGGGDIDGLLVKISLGHEDDEREAADRNG